MLGGSAPTVDELQRALAGVEDQLERRLLFVALLSSALESVGRRPPVIVGGNAVEFYTAGGYTTVDIDLVVVTEAVDDVLREWGFERSGRHWVHDRLGLVVEAPSSQLGTDETAHVLEVEVDGHVARIIGIEDLIVDRLSACRHWGDQESCEWAQRLLRSRWDLDVEYLRKRASEEDVAEVLVEAMEEPG